MGHVIVFVLANIIVFLALVAEIVPMPDGMNAADASDVAAADDVRVRMVIVGIGGVVNCCAMQIGVVRTASRRRGRVAVEYANRRFTCIGI